MHPNRMIWISDLHFDLVKEHRIEQLLNEVRQMKPQLVVITGDISTHARIDRDLSRFADHKIPTYFILGNHDYYMGGFAATETIVDELCEALPNLVRLREGTVVLLKHGIALVGIGGWGDGRSGLGNQTPVRMRDSDLIKDLLFLDTDELYEKLNTLGDASARSMAFTLSTALKMADHVYVATHVPPWEEACRHNGSPGTPEYLPHFVNVALGHAIMEIAKENPRKQITVLCGHTHDEYSYQAADDITVKVAGAIYGAPVIAGIFDLK